MRIVLRRLLFVLLAFAIVGGGARAAAVPVAARQMPSGMARQMPCGMTMPSHAAPSIPCKGMTPDCGKQHCCVADVAAPMPVVAVAPANRSTAVRYWSAWHAPASVVSTPEPLPPRTI